MGDTADGTWSSNDLLGYIRREEARKDFMDTKHTPGPWRASGGSLTVPKCHVLSGSGKASYALAHVFGETEVERMANARLIAAAPELLEACKAALPTLAREYPIGKSALSKQVQIAIAKAEGK